MCTNACAGNGCLCSGQKQGWGRSWLCSLQFFTLSLAMVATELAGSSAWTGESGAEAVALWRMCWGDVRMLGRAQGGFQSAVSTLGRGEATLWMHFKSSILVIYNSPVSPTGLQISKGVCLPSFQASGLRCLRRLKSFTPQRRTPKAVIPLSYSGLPAWTEVNYRTFPPLLPDSMWFCLYSHCCRRAVLLQINFSDSCVNII